MPLQRRIPKRGFTPRKRHVYQIVNVGELVRVEGTTINAQTLRDAGLIRSTKGLIKVLAMGELSQAYSVEAHKFSGGAAAKIEAAGGSVTTVGPVARAEDQVVTSEPAVEAEPAMAPEVKVAPEVEAEAEAEAEAEVEAEPETAATADPQTAVDSESVADPETAVDKEPATDSAPPEAENDG